MPSILFMNTELLSCPPTDNSARNCQHSSVNVKGSRHVSTALSCFFPTIFLRIDMMGDQRKLESGVKFHCSQAAKKITFFKDTLPSSLWLGHMGMFSYWMQSWWKERLCCCVNHGNDLHTLHLCALLVLLPHPIVYNLTANPSHRPFFSSKVSAHLGFVQIMWISSALGQTLIKREINNHFDAS